jgi:hypothetical protein
VPTRSVSRHFGARAAFAPPFQASPPQKIFSIFNVGSGSVKMSYFFVLSGESLFKVLAAVAIVGYFTGFISSQLLFRVSEDS